MASRAPRRSRGISAAEIALVVSVEARPDCRANSAGARVGSAVRRRFPASLAEAPRADRAAALPIGRLRRSAPARSAAPGKEPVAWGPIVPVGSAARRRSLGRSALGLVAIVPADLAVGMDPAARQPSPGRSGAATARAVLVGQRRSRGRSAGVIVPVGSAAVVSAAATGRASEGSRQSPRSRSRAVALVPIAPAPVARRHSPARSGGVGIALAGSVAAIVRPAPVA